MNTFSRRVQDFEIFCFSRNYANYNLKSTLLLILVFNLNGNLNGYFLTRRSNESVHNDSLFD